jgi:predicted AlkP superfamily pyrophosphatase or phosphodiesterase
LAPHLPAFPRATPAILAAVALLAASCTGDPVPGAPPGSRTVEEMARDVGTDVVRHVARGYRDVLSGEIAVVPEPWNVLGQWNAGVRGPNDPRTTHASPWDYHQRVPILLYGPGFIRSGVRSDRSVDVADLAPTFAELLGMEFPTPESGPLREALVPEARRPNRPAAIVLVVYDGGGWNVLERWPEAWPEERRLAGEGTAYTNATTGSAPAITAPVHANMGTGVYPEDHGLPENTARRPDGEIAEVYFHEHDPRLLLKQTVADVWDRRNWNRPWVGLIGFESWHLGMMGHGAALPGADRDVAALWNRDESEYWINREFYSFPRPFPQTLGRHLRGLDTSDGARDGRWRGNDLTNDFLIPGTPAFVSWERDIVRSMIEHSPIGRDDLTDLLFVEMKSADYGGHIWNMLRPHQAEILAAEDRLLGDLRDLLDARVGSGRYVLAVTADHGQTPIPTHQGGLRIDRYLLEDSIERYFGSDIVETIHPSEIFLDRDAVRDAGLTWEEVARYVGQVRYRDLVPEGTDPESVRGRLDDRVFAAALPGTYLEAVSETELAVLGPGDYREGDLTTPPPYLDALLEP